jgi:GTPase SAR1 family protein
MAKKKVLLMGKAHSGKTSMRSIIFANYLARDTTRLSPTLDVEHHHVRFLGDLGEYFGCDIFIGFWGFASDTPLLCAPLCVQS